MRTYSIAEAKRQLSYLIDRALSGEAIVITHRNRAIVELKPLAKQTPRRITDADIEWLDARRVGKWSPRKHAGQLVKKMRDEDEQST